MWYKIADFTIIINLLYGKTDQAKVHCQVGSSTHNNIAFIPNESLFHKLSFYTQQKLISFGMWEVLGAKFAYSMHAFRFKSFMLIRGL